MNGPSARTRSLVVCCLQEDYQRDWRQCTERWPAGINLQNLNDFVSNMFPPDKIEVDWKKNGRFPSPGQSGRVWPLHAFRLASHFSMILLDVSPFHRCSRDMQRSCVERNVELLKLFKGSTSWKIWKTPISTTSSLGLTPGSGGLLRSLEQLDLGRVKWIQMDCKVIWKSWISIM